MRPNRSVIFILTAFLLIISLACDISFGNNDNSEEEIRLELTRVSIQRTQTAAAAPQTNNAESADSSSDDADSEEADTDESSGEDEGGEDTDGADADSEDTCNKSHMISETIPDGSNYDPGDVFTKTWVVRNDGTCDWTTGYRFVFEQGNRMGGASSMNLTRTVHPGETYTFSVNLTAPSANGEYIGRWRIKSDDGENLGFYTAQIVVGPVVPPPPSFAVTSVSFYMAHTSIDMACPGDVTVSAEVTTSAGGVVGVKWENSLTSSLPTKSWTFAGAESKIMQHTVVGIPATGDYWAKLYIDAPNHQWFGPINFHINCTP